MGKRARFSPEVCGGGGPDGAAAASTAITPLSFETNGDGANGGDTEEICGAGDTEEIPVYGDTEEAAADSPTAGIAAPSSASASASPSAFTAASLDPFAYTDGADVLPDDLADLKNLEPQLRDLKKGLDAMWRKGSFPIAERELQGVLAAGPGGLRLSRPLLHALLRVLDEEGVVMLVGDVVHRV